MQLLKLKLKKRNMYTTEKTTSKHIKKKSKLNLVIIKIEFSYFEINV